MTRNQPNPSRPQATAVRCAVYTRKSSEEGLEQEFNSLDAQRESGEAYIASQKNERWSCLADRYDDGGFAGGNMERPAVKRLMADIEAGKIDCVVVYKVDRLSRSLMDFARMIGTFEKYKVSFVSDTQQFNTASSMGRLMRWRTRPPRPTPGCPVRACPSNPSALNCGRARPATGRVRAEASTSAKSGPANRSASPRARTTRSP